MALPAVVSSILSIGVQTAGADAIDSLAGKLGGLENVVKKVGKASSEAMLSNLFKPQGLDEIQLFRFARGLNTIAANIRFLQLTLFMFIGGNLVKGFMDLFVNLNAEMQSASLSLEAIIDAQKDMAMRSKLGIGPSDFMEPMNRAILKKQIARDVTELTSYASELAMRTGGSIPELIQTARGIQVNTKDVDATKRFMNIASTLSLLDPQQGMGGATFAIRELLQGQGARDFKSLAQRFELSFSMEFKKKFSESVQSGNIQDAIKMFEEELAGKGISDKILKNLEKSWILSVNVIKNQVALSFAKIGEPLFNLIAKELSKTSSFFIRGAGKDLGSLPQFNMIRTNLASILVEYIGQPLVAGMGSLKSYLLTFLGDPNTYSFIRKNLDMVVDIFKGFKDLFVVGLTSFYKNLGTLPNNGDLFKGTLQTISLLISKFGELFQTFMDDPQFLSSLDSYIKKWAEYVKLMLSPESQKTMVMWSKMGLSWKEFTLGIQMGFIQLINTISPLINDFRIGVEFVYFLVNSIPDAFAMIASTIITFIDLIYQTLTNFLKNPLEFSNKYSELVKTTLSGDAKKSTQLADELTNYRLSLLRGNMLASENLARERFRSIGINVQDKKMTDNKYWGYDLSGTTVSTQGETIGQLTKEQIKLLNKAIEQIEMFHKTVDQVTNDLNITNQDIKNGLHDYVRGQRINSSYQEASTGKYLFD